MEKKNTFVDENGENMNYPIGIQTFKDIRTDDFAYVDKTAHVYRLATRGKCYFLSRPRRFGKSLLLSTLKAYFQGKKELFEGLAIARLEREWKQYPVLHLDLNTALYTTPEALTKLLELHFTIWEKEYGIRSTCEDISDRFRETIMLAARQSPEGKVVILIDEYDKPMLETIGNPDLQDEYRKTLKAFYSNIKSCDEYIRFAFLTGVTKFSHLSIFSGLNNLKDITLDPRYAALCGFTQEELETAFAEGIEEFAEAEGVSRERILGMLKERYDGYHFSRDLTVGVYNPFSIINAFDDHALNAYWFATGTPNFLVEVIGHSDFSLDRLTTEEQTAEALDAIDAMYSNPIPLFFQSGYLTIKGYDPEFRTYSLGFPNTEVEQGFARFMATYYHGGNRKGTFNIVRFIEAVRKGDADGFMTLLKAFYADGDYQLVGSLEVYFQNSLMVLFKLLGFYVEVERHTSRGRMDVTLQTKDYVYVIELKVDQSAEAALCQIEEKQYAAPFAADPRTLFKIGVCFSSEERGVKEWKVMSSPLFRPSTA